MAQNNDKAVVKIGGKQYLVEAGNELLVEKISEKDIKNGKVLFDTVLAVLGSRDAITLGTPFTKNKVEATVLERELKSKKITVIKYKPKIRYKRKQGHRQVYSKIKIDSITT